MSSSNEVFRATTNIVEAHVNDDSAEVIHASMESVSFQNTPGIDEPFDTPASTLAATLVASSIPHADATVVSADAIDADIELATTEVDRSALGRAEFISATFFKPTADTKLGIKVADDGYSSLRIVSLKTDGMLLASPLRVGDMILSINGKTCADLDKNAAAGLLRQLVGSITVVAHNPVGVPRLVVTLIEKPSPTAKVGLGMKRNVRGSLEISKIVADGLFAHSMLNVGDRVISVNSVGCQQLEPRLALDIVRDTPKYVTLVSQTANTTGVVVSESSNLHGGGSIALPTSNPLLTDEDFRRFRHNSCFCTWMIILSLLIIGVTQWRLGS